MKLAVSARLPSFGLPLALAGTKGEPRPPNMGVLVLNSGSSRGRTPDVTPGAEACATNKCVPTLFRMRSSRVSSTLSPFPIPIPFHSRHSTVRRFVWRARTFRADRSGRSVLLRRFPDPCPVRRPGYATAVPCRYSGFPFRSGAPSRGGRHFLSPRGQSGRFHPGGAAGGRVAGLPPQLEKPVNSDCPSHEALQVPSRGL